MAINFETALGVHEQALLLRNRRSEVIANNIANADTPGYKARDLDFEGILKNHMDQKSSNLSMEVTGSNQFAHGMGDLAGTALLYRVPLQPSIDGNTVDEQVENAAFARNAIDHQASFQFLNGKLTGIMKALRGE